MAPAFALRIIRHNINYDLRLHLKTISYKQNNVLIYYAK